MINTESLDVAGTLGASVGATIAGGAAAKYAAKKLKDAKDKEKVHDASSLPGYGTAIAGAIGADKLAKSHGIYHPAPFIAGVPTAILNSSPKIILSIILSIILC